VDTRQGVARSSRLTGQLRVGQQTGPYIGPAQAWQGEAPTTPFAAAFLLGIVSRSFDGFVIGEMENRLERLARDQHSAECYCTKLKCVRKRLIINEILVEAAGVELIIMLTAGKLLILGTATTAKKAPLPDPLYVYCTKMLSLSGSSAETTHWPQYHIDSPGWIDKERPASSLIGLGTRVARDTPTIQKCGFPEARLLDNTPQTR